MVRIKDIEALAPKGNFAYGIYWNDDEGYSHMYEDDTWIEDVHREIIGIVLLDEYDEDGLPQIIYVVKREEEDIHFEPELIIPITLKDFFEMLHVQGAPIDLEADVPMNSDTYVLSFKMIPDPARKLPPKMEVTTSTMVIQIKIPHDYD